MDWWKGLFGPGYLFDPKDYFIVCANVLGSPYGSSAPTSLDFMQLSVRDIVQSHILLAEQLEIKDINIAIGGSFGGNQALEFAYSYSYKISNLILIASSATESAWSIAVHETQRMAMKSDKTFGKPEGGKEGMAAARAIGMLTYRTSEAFIESQTENEDKVDNFKASSYINYQGEKFIKRFDPLSYYYLTKCLDTHNLGRDRGGLSKTLNSIQTATPVIGIDSDSLIPTSLQKERSQQLANCEYAEISSDYGHDGFLVETEKLTETISEFLNSKRQTRTVFKFGGSSLKNGDPFLRSLEIIKETASQNPIAVIVSARGNTTNELISAYTTAVSGNDYQSLLDEIMEYQMASLKLPILEQYRKELNELLNSVKVLQMDIPAAKDKIIAYGELMSAQVISAAVIQSGKEAIFVDARGIIVTKQKEGELQVDMIESQRLTKALFAQIAEDVIPIITGLIAIDEYGRTTTLGRNGSNYSATLIAKFLQAAEIQN